MAFISIRSMSLRTGGRGIPPDKPNMILRVGKSGSCSGRFNKAMKFETDVVDIQVDQELRKVRVADSDSGFRLHKKTQSFSCSKALFEMLGSGKIYLEKSSDGWWYGTY